MNDLTIFNYNDNEVRTIQKDGEPWFVLKDVCQVLGLSNPTVVADRLDDDEKTKVDPKSHLGSRSNEFITVINEGGLYNVILRSDKPEAKPFKRWVTHEVLPSIRKHGAYMTPDKLGELLQDPDAMICLLKTLKDEREKNKTLQAENSALVVDKTIMQPKAEYFDEMVDRNLLTGFRETAKLLQVKPKEFVGFLLKKKYIYRDQKGKLMPHAKHVEGGLFEIKEGYNQKTQWSGTQTLITPKGRETFRLLMVGVA